MLMFNTPPDEISAEDRATVDGFVDRMLFEPRPGKSQALNAAVDACRTEIIAFTDDDALPHAGWLEAVIAPLVRMPDVDGVGGRVVPVYTESPPPRWYKRLVRRKQTHFLGPKHDHGSEARDYDVPEGTTLGPVPLGASCAWRTSTLRRVPFRSELGPNRATGMRGGEDTCLALEVLNGGGRIRYEPSAIVDHPVTSDRMTKEYVVEGFRRQGLEMGTILQILGRTVERPNRWRRTAGRRDLPAWVQRLWGPYRTLKRRIRREFASAVLASLSLDQKP